MSTNQKWPPRKYAFRVAAGILAVVAVGGAWLGAGLFGSPFHHKQTTYIYVRPTDTEATIMHQVAEATQASSMRGWRLASALTTFTPRTGRYAVHPAESMWSVYRKLQRGRQEPVRFTLPSTRTMERLAGSMAQKLMLDSAAVADSLADPAFAERYGYTTETLPALFVPNTYELYWDVTLGQFMQRMQREHEAFWQADGRQQKAKAIGMSTTEVATLASIIDEETAANAEKPRVAGMYMNRLAADMPLQADPTVKFAAYRKAREEGRSGEEELAWRRILNAALLTESPYNTYRNTGLPPGPIRIASIAGIDAVLEHEHHPYMYMCAKEDFSGTHNFAVTYAEHLANARRYTAALDRRQIKQ